MSPASGHRRSSVPGDAFDPWAGRRTGGRELQRSVRERDADRPHDPPVGDVVLGHRAAIAANEERLFGAAAEEHPGSPQLSQETSDLLRDAGPRLLVARREDDPRGSGRDRARHEVQKATNVDRLPGRIDRHRHGAAENDSLRRRRFGDEHVDAASHELVYP